MKIKKTLSEQLKEERETKFRYQQLGIKNIKSVELVVDSDNKLYSIAYNYRSNYTGNKYADVDKILKYISNLFNVSIEDMQSNKRNENIVYARYISIFIIYHFLPLSLNKIGIIFGNRNHSTIRYAVFKIADNISIYPHAKQEINNILKKLKFI